MPNLTPTSTNPPARTHAEAVALFRRPFAPGAIGFRAMMKVPYNGDPFGGAQVAAYIGAQSVLQRLNAVVPGRWHQEFRLLDPPPGARRLYMACRLIVTLPITDGGPEIEAVYEDVGEMDSGSRAGLKALYSDARKRAAVAAGIGAYLYTALEPVVLAIGPQEGQVQVVRRPGKPVTLTLSAATEESLRHGYTQRMSTEAVRRDLGEILAHGEPERGMGQGEAAEQPAEPAIRRRSGTATRRWQGRTARVTPAGPPHRRRATAWWWSTSAASDPTPPDRDGARPHDTTRGRRRGAVRADDQRRAAGGAHSRAHPPSRALRRRAAPPPLGLVLHAVAELPGRVAPALHPGREATDHRIDVPGQPRRRRAVGLLPADPRARRPVHA
jgi:hypothetical protein